MHLSISVRCSNNIWHSCILFTIRICCYSINKLKWCKIWWNMILFALLHLKIVWNKIFILFIFSTNVSFNSISWCEEFRITIMSWMTLTNFLKKDAKMMYYEKWKMFFSYKLWDMSSKLIKKCYLAKYLVKKHFLVKNLTICPKSK